jgi:tRNA-2-methylthio-N6-dimethylallyladenosine synthase
LLEDKAIIRKLRAARPGISITTDLIVGFPGETERQFQRTLEMARRLRFDGGFAFIYSPRPGTPAASFPDTTSRAAKVRRLEELNTVLQTETRKRSASYIGTIASVLVEGKAKRGEEMAGRLPDNRVINCEGHAEPGELREARVTGTSGYVLKGEFLPVRG